MNATDLKTQLMNKQLNSMYIFTGEEIAIRDIYVNKIIELSTFKSIRLNSVLDVYRQLNNKSLLGSTNAVYIVSNDKEYLNTYDKYINLQELLKSSILIVLYDNIDMRSKFYKAHTDTIVKFEHLSKDVIIKHVQSDTELNNTLAEALVEACENDYSRILLEIDKIKQYSLAKNISHNEALMKLFNDNTIYVNPYDAIFDFVDAVAHRDIKKSFELLQTCKYTNEPSLIMLSVLFNVLKQLLQVQSCEGRDIAKITGLTKWQISKASTHLNKYRNGELVKAMRLISKVVADIKIGKIEDSMSVDYVLVNVL